MTTDDITLLITGATVGAHAVNLLHLRWNQQAAARAAAVSRAVAKDAAGDRFLSSMVVYRLQQRSRA